MFENSLEYPKWRRALLPLGTSIQEAIRNLDEVALQIILVTDKENRLIGTLSDGDIRRGLLKGLQISSSIESIIHQHPLVVPATLSRDLVLQLMSVNKIHQIPIVDDENRVLGLHLWNEMNVQQLRSNTIVIMAGGKGTRLRPHTEACPKPMLEVGGKPILEHIINRAKAEGFKRFVITVHYLAQMIEQYFGNGESMDVSIEYLKEDSPLGTAGALSILPKIPDQPLIVTNGDVMTDIRYGELLDFHQRHESFATMAVRLHEWQHPYGVVRIRGIDIIGFEEKPIARNHINAGVYTLSPEALQYLVKGEALDMPTLFDRLQQKGMRTVAYPMHEPWLDVGRPSDLKLAEEAIQNVSRIDSDKT